MASSEFAATSSVPYYAVIFSSQRTEGDAGYPAAADRMVELASDQPGFMGVESARGPDGFGITVSYWRDEASIHAWKQHLEHRRVQERGMREWYEHYEVRVALVTRAYGKPRSISGGLD